VKFLRQYGRKDLWNLFVWPPIEGKGWEFLTSQKDQFSVPIASVATPVRLRSSVMDGRLQFLPHPVVTFLIFTRVLTYTAQQWRHRSMNNLPKVVMQ